MQESMRVQLDAAAAVKSSSLATQQDVIDAAIRCFKRYGAGRTRMGDIAEEAGISRKTLYRIFEDRPALVNRVLSQTLNTMGKKVERELKTFTTVREAVIEGSIRSVKIGLKDKLFNDIVKSETHYRVEQFLMLGDSKVRADMLRIWAPVIDRGREERLIRTDLSNERVTEILQNVHSLLLIRGDEGEASQRTFLKDLLWAAITNSDVQ